MSVRFREASPADLARVGRSLVVARVAADLEDLALVQAQAPWRFRIGDKGDVMVLDTWRDHLPYLAIELLLCSPARLRDAVRHAQTLASDLGYSDVVSPPVALEDSDGYRSAGMRPQTVVATYRLNRASGPKADPTPGDLTIRDAAAEDIEVLLQLDSRCFEPFWRYDRRHMERFCATAHLRLAERSGEAVGYTLCTIGGDEGLLGRLCVAPEHRRRGIANSLLSDAVRREWERGAERVTLSTQTDNAPAQALYRKAGFRDTGRRYAFLRFGADEGRRFAK